MSLRILQIRNTCTGCGACVSACTNEALTLRYDDEGFYFPQLDEQRCVRCHLCEKACHVLNVQHPQEPIRDFTPYMIKAKDNEVVQGSSSGGAFTLLAVEILKQGGVVYGARYDFDKERLEHCSTDQCSMDELRKSKYIESYMGRTCQEVKAHLDSGRNVLFCGTPCQIEGLHQYLKVQKADTTHLFLVRILCHGVPANQAFTEYKHYEEKKHGAAMTTFDFRPKINGWWSIDWKMAFKNGIVNQGIYNTYYYYYYYYRPDNLLLRRSCYHCDYMNTSTADVTIADFWGIKSYCPTKNDNHGISLLLAHSDKATRKLKDIEAFAQMEQLPQSAVDYIYRSAEKKVALFDQRLAIHDAIVSKGYLKIMKKAVRHDVIKYKVLAFISRIRHKK